VQEAVRSGQLTPVQAESHPRRSQLTRALGVGDDVDVDVEVLEPRTGDRLLLCSDGLWDEVGDELIIMVLGSRDEPEEAASELVRWAKEAGGRDNITVIVLDVVDGGETERGVAASAVLDEAGDETTAVSRPGAATVALSADEAGTGKGGASTRARGSIADGSLMQATADARPAGAASSSRSRLVTWRVVAFLVVLLIVVGAAAAIVTRAEPAWTVALDGNTVVVKEGDQIRERTPLQLNQLTPGARTELLRASGKRVEDRAAAKAYVDRIGLEAAAAGSLPLPGGAVIGTTTSAAVGTPAPPTTLGGANGGTGSSVPIGP